MYEQSHGAGGTIPYTVIREVSENFIHARFKEVVVSILDKGNTIRFADHGPGIPSKEKAQMPGFSSAVEPMKNYIRGVGSGLPIVREYLESSHGTITIEDNLGTGAVVTVSLVREEDDPLDDWDETDVLSSKREYTSGSSYASETAVVHQPYAAPLAAVTEPYPSNPAGIYPSMGSSSAPGATPYPPAYAPQGYSAVPAAPAPVPAPSYGAPYQGYPSYGAYGAAPTAYPAYGAAPAPAAYPGYPSAVMPAPALSERERIFLKLLLKEGTLRNKDFSDLTETPASTTNTTLNRLREAGLVEMVGKQRALTPYGRQIAQGL